MPITYNLAPIPVWYFLDLEGQPAANGYMYTYRDTARNEYKPVYQHPSGTLPYPDPVRLDGTGKAGPFYWADDENYYLRITDSAGNTIKTIEHFNAPGDGGASVTTQLDIKNFIQNGQFRLNFGDVDIEALENIVAEHWFFRKSNLNATDKISFVKFPLGQTEVESNPTYYCRFQCTNVGLGGETYKVITTGIPDVNLFSGEEITFSIAARSTTLSPLKIRIEQHFGYGPAASSPVDTIIIDTTLTANWTKYHGTVTLPSISGKTIDASGVGHGDMLFIGYDLPVNQIADIESVNFQLERGNKVSIYEEETIGDEWMRNRGSLLPVPAKDNSDKGKILTVINDYNVNVDFKKFPLLGWQTPKVPGEGAIWFAQIPPFGCWECDGRETIRTDYPILYNNITDGGTAIYWGLPSRTSLDATRTGSLVVASTITFGNVTDAADVDTGFTISTVQQGSSTQVEITHITCLAASSITPGAKFLINTLDEEYIIYYIKDGIGDEPIYPGKTKIKCLINGSDTSDEVAEATKNILHHIKFFIPDLRDVFLRGWGHGASYSANRPVISLIREGFAAIATISAINMSFLYNGKTITISGADQSEYNGSHVITIRSPTEFEYPVSGIPSTPATGDIRLEFTFIPDPDRANRIEFDRNGVRETVVGDKIGSYQNDELKDHRHDFTIYGSYSDFRADDVFTGYRLPGIVDQKTKFWGGHESRSKNKSIMVIIKY